MVSLVSGPSLDRVIEKKTKFGRRLQGFCLVLLFNRET